MSQEWSYTKNGQQFGPVELADLQRLAASGDLAPGDLLWKPPATAWIPATQVAALAFPGTTPPTGSPAMAATPAVLAYQGIASPGEVFASSRAIDMLRGTKPWVRFLSIFAFVIGGLMIVGGASMSLMLSRGGGPGIRSAIIGGGAYLVFGLIAIVFGLYLFRFASSIAALLVTNHSEHLEKALEAQRSFWRLAGIMTIVLLVLYFGMIAIFALVAWR
jgi:hypothetical protein